MKTDMNALFNADIKRGMIGPLYAGFIPCVLPESPIGVSVKYVPAPDKQWFALHATYNRKNKVCDFIIKDKTEIYFPMHYVHKRICGKRQRILEPLLSQLIFVYQQEKKSNVIINQEILSESLRVISKELKVKVARQQKVVVEIKGLCLIVTAYIPSGFITTYRTNK